jgi:serine/threonine protein kinase
VFRARDVERSRDVALKILRDADQASLGRIRREFRTLAGVHLPHVVRFFELGTHGALPFYTMELVDGQPFLASAATTRAAADAELDAGVTTGDVGLPESSLLREWMLQLAEGIEALHCNGLLHLDIKPANLLVRRDRRLVVVDFGLAAPLDGIRVQPVRYGTPGYWAPECRTGHRPGTPADWYSVGATFAHALLGVPPGPHGFRNDNLERLGALGNLGVVCKCLLAENAASRPGAAEVRSMLGAPAAQNRVQTTARSDRPRPLPARDHVEQLVAMHLDALPRHTVSFLVGAPERRSVTLATFVELLAANGPTTVLETRAREWENVPFGVLEGIRPDGEESLAPTERDMAGELTDRWSAWLHRSETSGRILIRIDDAHWCDQDSVDVLIRVMRPGAGYRVHLVLGVLPTHRRAPAIERIRGWLAELPASVRWNELAVGEIAEDETELAELRELLVELPETERRYLELLSLEDASVRQEAMRNALGPRAEEFALPALRAHGLVVTDGPRLADRVETSSKRVRESVLAGIDPARRRRLHLDLARSLARCASAVPASVARHYSLAGYPRLACEFALVAANQARTRGAHQRASEFYQSALHWGDLSADRTQRTLMLLSESLRASGRAAEAAAVRLDAARLQPPGEARVSRRFAAEQLLICGRYDEGRSQLAELAADVGIAFPHAFPRILLGVARALLHELVGLPRPGAAADDAADVALAGFRGLMPIDPPRAAYFSTTGLHLARHGGSKAVLGNALVSVASGFLAPAGGVFARWADRMIGEAESLSRGIDDALLASRVDLARASIAFWKGRWKEAHALAERSAETLDRSAVASSFDTNILNLVLTRSLEEQGYLSRSAQRTGRMLADGMERDDRYAVVTATLSEGMIAIARDDPEGAIQCARRAVERWTVAGLQVQHVYALRVEAYAELYRGDAERAWQLLEAAWPEIRSGMHLRIPAGLVDLQLLRGRLALALFARDRRAPWDKRVGESIRALESTHRADAIAHARTLRAGIAFGRGDRNGGIAELGRAASTYRHEGLQGMERLCELVSAGTSRSDAAREGLVQLGIANPARWAAAMIPT